MDYDLGSSGREIMGSAEQANEEYQARIKKGDDIRATMWGSHDTVVSALTTREVTHEQALTVAKIREAITKRDLSEIIKLSVVLCDSFDECLFEYVADQSK